MTDEPTTTAAFAAGARGEERVAEYLRKACGDQALFLHNRRLGPGRRDGDIDHLAVTASGVFVVDAKNYRSATVEVRRRGGLFGPVREQLIVSGRDRTGLLDSAHRQQRAVAVALDATAAGSGLPLTAVLCFLDADIAGWGRQRIAGVAVAGLRGTARLLSRPGPLDAAARQRVWRELDGRLPPA